MLIGRADLRLCMSYLYTCLLCENGISVMMCVFTFQLSPILITPTGGRTDSCGWLQTNIVFTVRLHVMQRTVLRRQFCPPVCLSVCLSICLSNVWIVTKHILIPHERAFVLVFWQEECLVGDDHFYLKFWFKLTQLLEKRRFSIDFRSSRHSRKT